MLDLFREICVEISSLIRFVFVFVFVLLCFDSPLIIGATKEVSVTHRQDVINFHKLVETEIA